MHLSMVEFRVVYDAYHGLSCKAIGAGTTSPASTVTTCRSRLPECDVGSASWPMSGKLIECRMSAETVDYRLRTLRRATMSLIDDVRNYECWLRRKCDVVEEGLRKKHDRMAKDAFKFFRATCFRFARKVRNILPDLAEAPTAPAVGDAHIENWGTWRDAEGRLVWGVNDFDEAADLPYTYDLLRLAVSARFAGERQGAHGRDPRRLSRRPVKPASAFRRRRVFLDAVPGPPAGGEAWGVPRRAREPGGHRSASSRGPRPSGGVAEGHDSDPLRCLATWGRLARTASLRRDRDLALRASRTGGQGARAVCLVLGIGGPECHPPVPVDGGRQVSRAGSVLNRALQVRDSADRAGFRQNRPRRRGCACLRVRPPRRDGRRPRRHPPGRRDRRSGDPPGSQCKGRGLASRRVAGSRERRST